MTSLYKPASTMKTGATRRSHPGLVQLAGLVLATCMLGPVVAQQCAPVPAGAIAWYRAEHNPDDAIGFINGSMTNGATFGPGRVGEESFRFDADLSHRVDLSSSASEVHSVRNNFSYELWARPTASLAACPESNTSCGVQNLRWAISPSHGDNAVPPEDVGLASGIGVGIGTNGICVGEHSSNLIDCLARLDTAINDWAHIVVVVQNKIPRIYLNGVLARTGLTSLKSYVFLSREMIGSVAALGRYSGDLDEVTYYDRALSDSEIAALAAAGSAGKCITACVVNEGVADVWQNAQVLNTSGLLSNIPSGMFGAINALPEVNTTLFADNLPDGTVHSIEWQTSTPVNLRGFELSALGGEPLSNPQRSFRNFTLQARPIGGNYATVFSSPVLVPYTPTTRFLARCVSVRPQNQVQQFRAEFTQNGPAGFSGPRVVELNGVGIPELLFADGFE